MTREEAEKIACEIVDFVEGKKSPYMAPEVPPQLYREEITNALLEASKAKIPLTGKQILNHREMNDEGLNTAFQLGAIWLRDKIMEESK